MRMGVSSGLSEFMRWPALSPPQRKSEREAPCASAPAVSMAYHSLLPFSEALSPPATPFKASVSIQHRVMLLRMD